MEKYPEHQKIKAVKPQTQAINSFLDAMEAAGIVLCQFEDSLKEYLPIRKTRPELLANFFEIDLTKIDQEKEAMLDECRRAHTSGSGA